LEQIPCAAWGTRMNDSYQLADQASRPVDPDQGCGNSFSHPGLIFSQNLPPVPYICSAKPVTMEQMQKPKYKIKVNGKYLLLGLLSTAACIYMIIFMSQFFWIMLPFVFTFLALSIDAL
jgi:hypothetical protein